VAKLKPKICPILTIADSRGGHEPCLREYCQLWWFCKGDELSEKGTVKLPAGKTVVPQ